LKVRSLEGHILGPTDGKLKPSAQEQNECQCPNYKGIQLKSVEESCPDLLNRKEKHSAAGQKNNLAEASNTLPKHSCNDPPTWSRN
jgi:hypothetical protein